ncbi:putative F-box domain-containing protein [Helianthus annuus]|nr:putative F-box domain-containing protein [Helianthus annuus]
MADHAHEDVVEGILIRLDVKDLIRCKSVCKSWHSLITSPRFISSHLNRSYNKDRHDNKFGHRRICLVNEFSSGYFLVGSCNGLVCIICVGSCKLLVANPLTREVRELQLPSLIGSPLCWGFGYDLSKDDYIVVVGAEVGKFQTCFKVLSLKSNVWRVIGDVKYKFITKIGMLCNGALHWIVEDQNRKILILSYDLSEEEFKEIPQPEDDASYKVTLRSYLGIVKGCLCTFHRSRFDSSVVDVWLMKKYNVKHSWELLPLDHKMKNDIVQFFRLPADERFSYNVKHSWFSRTLKHIYVQSLVSPHVNVTPKQYTKWLHNYGNSYFSWTNCLSSKRLKQSRGQVLC